MNQKKIKVLFVCLGNICRSPVAEGTFQYLVEKQNLSSHFDVDSAGTSAWHIGEQANPRSQKTAQKSGIQLKSRARQFTRSDFESFDHIIAMDNNNLTQILLLSSDTKEHNKVEMMRRYEDNNNDNPHPLDVPDPYYGGQDGFDDVQNILLHCCTNLLRNLTAKYNLKARSQ